MNLAEFVAQEHDALLASFVKKARARAESEGISQLELIDSMPLFLDILVEAIASDVEGRARETGSAHGEQRLRVGFAIDQVVREYFMVSTCILEAADAAGVRPTAEEARRLMQVIGEGAAAAAREYAKRREADVVRREAVHAGFLAHELRSSLTGARFAFDLMRRKTQSDAHELVEVIDGSLRRASQHIDDALLGQRLRSAPVAPSALLLRRLVDDVAAELRAQADEKSITMSFEVDRELSLKADPRLLRSALANVLGNAIKFTERNGHVAVRAQVQEERVEVQIEDQCGGLPPGGQERMFAPFAQASSDRSGFGLGLSIARTAIEAQGGTLTVRDRPGTGCVFTLSLPRMVVSG